MNHRVGYLREIFRSGDSINSVNALKDGV